MDLFKLSRMLNSTAQVGNMSQFNLAPNILEAVIPGYSIISRFVSQSLGFDAGYIVSAGLLLFAFAKAWQYISKTFWLFITNYASSLIYVEEHDELFKSMLDWIAEQRVGRMATRLKAVTKQGSNPEDDRTDDHEIGAGELFHFGKWAAKVPPKVWTLSLPQA
jgi:chaperone BCS1